MSEFQANLADANLHQNHTPRSRQFLCGPANPQAKESTPVRPVTLAEIKSNRKFADFALVRISRLSIMPVTREQWAAIEKLSKEAE